MEIPRLMEWFPPSSINFAISVVTAVQQSKQFLSTSENAPRGRQCTVQFASVVINCLKGGQLKLHLCTTTLFNTSILGICEELPPPLSAAVISALISFIDQFDSQECDSSSPKNCQSWLFRRMCRLFLVCSWQLTWFLREKGSFNWVGGDDYKTQNFLMLDYTCFKTS